MGDVVDAILRIAGALGLPALLLWALKERRKTRAEGAVAERTVGAVVQKTDAGALEAHVLAIERAFSVERASKDRRIAELEERLDEVRQDCAEQIADVERRKDALIGELRDQVATLTARLNALTGERP